MQSLLARHEAYVAETAKELANRSTQICDLEDKNESLREENSRIAAENDGLFSRIDVLNRSVDESEAQLSSLTATLRRTEAESQRLKTLAARTETLEEQLSGLETELEALQSTLETTVEEERVTKHRWRESQRVIFDLEAQVEMIEREATMDGSRRQRSHNHPVERHRPHRSVTESIKPKPALGTSATDAVTKFLKEVIEENARLQMNTAELEAMLVRSQEESEQLRDQVAASSPIREDSADVIVQPERSLDQELQNDHPASLMRNVTHRRPPRLRASMSNRQLRRTRWSTDSHYSRPSMSNFSMASTWTGQASDSDSTRPTSPESAWSPTTRPRRFRTDAEESISRPLSATTDGFDSYAGLDEVSKLDPHTLKEDLNNVLPNNNSDIESSMTTIKATDSQQMPPPPSPQRPSSRLKRVSSSSSLYSISGMDVHSSMPTRREMTPASLRVPRLLSDRDRVDRPMLSATISSATGASRSSGHNVGDSLRNSLGDNSRQSGSGNGYTPLVDTFGRRVGGWLTGRWSAGQQSEKLASTSVGNLKSTISKSDIAAARSRKHPSGKDGARKRKSVITSSLDQEALEECLKEDEITDMG